MTLPQITLSLGIPKQTLYGWRGGKKSDWRYKLVQLLMSEAITPTIVESILTKLPEINQSKPEQDTLATTLNSLSEEETVAIIKQLQARLQQGAADAKLRSNSGEK